MVPQTSDLGIGRVVDAYRRHLPDCGVQFVDDASKADLVVSHAGYAASCAPDVLHCHGLYPTYQLDKANRYWQTNAVVVDGIARSSLITVPSSWVALSFQRDMHMSPAVVPNGIDIEDWPLQESCDNYVLWGKGHQAGVCDSSVVNTLAKVAPDWQFVSTFGESATNVKVIGPQSYQDMRHVIQHAGIYLATSKETFGIQTLEAMASGVPVVGYRWGGTSDIITHMEDGWLAEPGDIDGLLQGLSWAQSNRTAVAQEARRNVQSHYTWDHVCEQVYNLYGYVLRLKRQSHSISVVIPCHNYGDRLDASINSVLKQSFRQEPVEIIIVDDASSDNTAEVAAKYSTVRYERVNYHAVADARNHGIRLAKGDLIACLDADDEMLPEFLSALVPELRADRSLGIAYGSILAHDDITGTSTQTAWPPAFDLKQQITRHNCIPSACVFRKEAWERAGGFRQRYAPAEDAELWTRMLVLGYRAKRAVEVPLYIYHMHDGSQSRILREPDWLADKSFRYNSDMIGFAALPTNGRASNPFRNYDDPWVSIIIPVGPGHESVVCRALDSVEQQTMPYWEVIVVNDSGNDLTHPGTHQPISQAYPYIVQVDTKGHQGPAIARNLGVTSSYAPLLLFLDADDWLHPEFLTATLDAYNEDSNHYIYTDFTNVKLDGHTEEVRCKEFTCQGMWAQSLHNVTTLLPKSWHNEINGFDGTLSGWEDWDYYLSIVKAGHQGKRVPRSLMYYDHGAGTRRESSLALINDLLPVIRERYKEVETMSCGSCGGGRGKIQHQQQQSLWAGQAAQSQQLRNLGRSFMEESVVLVMDNSGNMGKHAVVGARTHHEYGYHAHGDIFEMRVEDAKASPRVYVIVTQQQATSQPVPVKPVAPEPVAEPVEPTALPIIEEVPQVAAEMQDNEEPEVDISMLGLAQIKKLDLSPEDAAAALEYEQANKNRSAVVTYLTGLTQGK